METEIKITLYVGDHENSVKAQVLYTWTPAERGEREFGTGMALSPDYPAGYEIDAVMIGAADIYAALSGAQIMEIERMIADGDA